MAPLPDRLTPAGRRILDTAAELFYQQGIHAVGVDAIAARAGVTKRTLYACFGSKDHLVAAYLAERDQRWRDWLTGWVADRAHSPRERLLAVFDALEAWMTGADFRGCGFVNALAELAAPDHPARAVIAEQKQWVRDYLAELARGAGAGDPDDVAETALLLYEGATVAASTGMSDAAQRARRTVAALIDRPTVADHGRQDATAAR